LENDFSERSRAERNSFSFQFRGKMFMIYWRLIARHYEDKAQIVVALFSYSLSRTRWVAIGSALVRSKMNFIDVVAARVVSCVSINELLCDYNDDLWRRFF
jgi:hypothetical protein